MTNSILLSGPPKSGKTTVGTVLAAQLDLPFYDLGDNSRRYRAQTAFDPLTRVKIYQDEGFTAVWPNILSTPKTKPRLKHVLK